MPSTNSRSKLVVPPISALIDTFENAVTPFSAWRPELFRVEKGFESGLCTACATASGGKLPHEDGRA
jgi:hypothetical protein